MYNDDDHEYVFMKQGAENVYYIPDSHDGMDIIPIPSILSLQPYSVAAPNSRIQ